MPYVFNPFTGNLDSSGSSGAGTGDVVGPASSTDNAAVRFDGTSGVAIQNSGVIISDTDDITGAASIALDLGATINEFSIDGTLSGNSDTAVPTEKAVKTYVDSIPSGSGDVVGPASSTDNAIARFDSTTGKLIQNSSLSTISDTGVLQTAELTLTTDLAVSHGGTGLSSTTAYAVLCGGTTGTAALQSIASVGTSGHVLTSNGAGALPTFQASAGGTPPPREFFYDAASLHATETNFATLPLLAGATTRTFVRSFDQTTEWYVNGKLVVPSDFDASGTITFDATVMAATAAASKNIGLTFGHRPVNDSESFNGAYVDVDTGAVAIDATQDDVTKVSWSVANSTAGWAAGDTVFFRLSRDVSVADNLASAMYLFDFVIGCPRA
jgi:hypothetical protein